MGNGEVYQNCNPRTIFREGQYLRVSFLRKEGHDIPLSWLSSRFLSLRSGRRSKSLDLLMLWLVFREGFPYRFFLGHCSLSVLHNYKHCTGFAYPSNPPRLSWFSSS
jgi:hypothetical protein